MATMTGDDGGDILAGPMDQENTILGMGGGDQLTGGGRADRIEGGDGDDILSGGGGDDRIFGGRGNDLVLVGQDGDSDVVFTGGGRDVIQASGDSLLTDILRGGANVDWIDNVGGRSLVLGEAMARWTGIERIFGAGQAIEARGGAGGGATLDFSDYRLVLVSAIIGTAGNDSIAGSGGDDVIRGGAGRDLLRGGLRHDEIAGGAGDDRLFGQGGRDTLDGGAGADMLRGGGGADVFRYSDAADSAAGAPDRIRDFDAGRDVLDLSAIDAVPDGGAGDAAFAWIGTAGFSGTAGELRQQDLGGGDWQVQGDVDGDGLADLSIRLDGPGAGGIGADDLVL